MSLLDFLYRWQETYELSFQLSNVVFTLLETMIDYCKKNEIPFHEATEIWNLTQESIHIFELIEKVNSPDFKPPKLPESLTRRKFTDDSTRRGLDRT